MVGCNLYQHNRKKKNKMQSTFEDFIGIFDESISKIEMIVVLSYKPIALDFPRSII